MSPDLKVVLVGLRADESLGEEDPSWWLVLLPSLAYVLHTFVSFVRSQVDAKRRFASLTELVSAGRPVSEDPRAHAEHEFSKAFQMHRVEYADAMAKAGCCSCCWLLLYVLLLGFYLDGQTEGGGGGDDGDSGDEAPFSFFWFYFPVGAPLGCIFLCLCCVTVCEKAGCIDFADPGDDGEVGGEGDDGEAVALDREMAEALLRAHGLNPDGTKVATAAGGADRSGGSGLEEGDALSGDELEALVATLAALKVKEAAGDNGGTGGAGGEEGGAGGGDGSKEPLLAVGLSPEKSPAVGSSGGSGGGSGGGSSDEERPIEDLSVTELRTLIDAAGLSSAGLLEKPEFVAKAREARSALDAKAGAGAAAGAEVSAADAPPPPPPESDINDLD